MAAAFGERQRAEEFARLLDGLGGTGDAPGSGVATLERPVPGSRIPHPRDPEMAEMLRAVEVVIDFGREHPPMARPEFREALERRLHAEFLTLFNADVDDSGGNGGEPIGRHRTSSPWRRRLIGGSVAVGVLSGGVGGVAWAASGALPGDPLYGVKRSLENMRVSVSGSDLERGSQYLGQAKTRLAEVQHLLDRKDANVDGSETSRLIADTMDNLYTDVENAGQLLIPLADKGNATALKNMSDFLTPEEPQVGDLQVLLAPESQDKARRLVALMQTYDERVAAARTALERHAAAHSGSGTGTGRQSGTSPSSGAGAAPSSTTGAESPYPDGPPTPGGATSNVGGPQPPSPSSDTSLSVQVPIGSPQTTVVVPPLLSGLPPIGITIGGGPATGPTSDAGPPPTDPNPN
jgi:hypothetical protein